MMSVSARWNEEEETRRQEAAAWMKDAKSFVNFEEYGSLAWSIPRRVGRRNSKSSSPSSKRLGKPWPRPSRWAEQHIFTHIHILSALVRNRGVTRRSMRSRLANCPAVFYINQLALVLQALMPILEGENDRASPN